MATDNLTQTGKRLRKTRVQIQDTSRYVSRNYPLIEKSGDILGSINPYRFEFKTYIKEASVFLSIRFEQIFRTLKG